MVLLARQHWATKSSWFLRKFTGLWDKRWASLGIPLPLNWCCPSVASFNACYYPRLFLTIPQDTPSLPLTPRARVSTLRQSTACRANSKVHLFCTWLHCPFGTPAHCSASRSWLAQPATPASFLPPTQNAYSWPPVLTTECLMQLRIPACRPDLGPRIDPGCCVTHTGVNVWLGR